LLELSATDFHFGIDFDFCPDACAQREPLNESVSIHNSVSMPAPVLEFGNISPDSKKKHLLVFVARPAFQGLPF
jgi:hypothetical protein